MHCNFAITKIHAQLSWSCARIGLYSRQRKHRFSVSDRDRGELGKLRGLHKRLRLLQHFRKEWRRRHEVRLRDCNTA